MDETEYQVLTHLLMRPKSGGQGTTQPKIMRMVCQKVEDPTVRRCNFEASQLPLCLPNMDRNKPVSIFMPTSHINSMIDYTSVQNSKRKNCVPLLINYCQFTRWLLVRLRLQLTNLTEARFRRAWHPFQSARDSYATHPQVSTLE